MTKPPKKSGKISVGEWFGVLEQYHVLLYDVIHCLDEDFVPGPKFSDLCKRYYELTGLKLGDDDDLQKMGVKKHE